MNLGLKQSLCMKVKKHTKLIQILLTCSGESALSPIKWICSHKVLLRGDLYFEELLWINQHRCSRNVCLCAAWPLSQQYVENNWNDCRANRRCTHSNKCMTKHAREQTSDVYLPASHRGHCHWLQGEPPVCTRGTYWCHRVGIFAYHRNIKSPCSFIFF